MPSVHKLTSSKEVTQQSAKIFCMSPAASLASVPCAINAQLTTARCATTQQVVSSWSV